MKIVKPAKLDGTVQKKIIIDDSDSFDREHGTLDQQIGHGDHKQEPSHKAEIHVKISQSHRTDSKEP